jgi:hypothetical protein
MSRSRRLLAAAALAVVVILAASGCHDITEANVPAPPTCPAGQYWRQSDPPNGDYACLPPSGPYGYGPAPSAGSAP